MWGALIFLVAFLVIDPTARDLIVGAVEDARMQLAIEAPLPYFLLVIVIGSALVSTLIMKYWPSADNRSRRVQIVHRYQGQAASDLDELRPAPSLGLRLLAELMYYVLPLRARMACRRLLGSPTGFAGLKRVPRA